MGLQASAARAAALQRPGPAAVGAGQRRRHARLSPAVAHARRKKDEQADLMEELAAEWKGLVSPGLAAQADDLVQMLPDPANPPESLLDEGFDNAYLSSSYATSSGSDLDWQAPGGSDWLMSDFYDGGGGGHGQLAEGATGGDFFELRSADWADSLVSEVGEGNSFRREQQERYGPPLMKMTNLAHATEEDLLLGAEQQALQEDRVERAMDKAMTLHHSFLENSNNRFAICVRFGELLEEIEYDDWVAPFEGEEQGLPSWCRAAFRMEHEYEELNEEVRLGDELHSAEEMAFFDEQVEEHMRRHMRSEESALGGGAIQAADETDPLEELLRVALPGETEEFDREQSWDFSSSESLADELLNRVDAATVPDELLGKVGPAAERDFISVRSGDAFGELEVEAGVLASTAEAEEEEAMGEMTDEEEEAVGEMTDEEEEVDNEDDNGAAAFGTSMGLEQLGGGGATAVQQRGRLQAAAGKWPAAGLAPDLQTDPLLGLLDESTFDF